MADTPRTVVVDWPDVKRAYLAAIEDGKTIPNQKEMNNKIKGWHKYPTASNSWEGGSPADTCNYLRNGYHAETFAHSAEYAAISVRNRFAYNEEEGEIDIDRVLDGQDAIYLNREERESRPGLRLMIEFAFVHDMPAKVISQYGAWVASLIQSLEATGYDLVVDVWINLNSLFKGDGGLTPTVAQKVAFLCDASCGQNLEFNDLAFMAHSCHVLADASSCDGSLSSTPSASTSKCRLWARAMMAAAISIAPLSWGISRTKL